MPMGYADQSRTTAPTMFFPSLIDESSKGRHAKALFISFPTSAWRVPLGPW